MIRRTAAAANWRSVVVALAGVLAGTWISAGGQQRGPQYHVPPVSDLAGNPALQLALRQLDTVGTLLHTTAHPDDENNAMLAEYAWHHGERVALLTATRGDGGQNELGPELFDTLGMLRTEELLAAHRYDGAEQYFTRAVDFGYSFSVDETLRKWGHDEILGDFVRHIRTLRPDVIVALGTEGELGGQHHQASAVLTEEAFAAAADPARYPEQVKAGLRPWQARKLYRIAHGPGAAVAGAWFSDEPKPLAADARVAILDPGRYEASLGCTIGEIGRVAAGMHQCQGRVPLTEAPGPRASIFRLMQTAPGFLVGSFPETSLFSGIDTSITSLASFAGVTPPSTLTTALSTIGAQVTAARTAAANGDSASTIATLAAGLKETRDLRSTLAGLVPDAAARGEVDSRLARKEQQFQSALVLARGLRFEALADDGVIVRGQTLQVSVNIATRGERAGGDVRVRGVEIRGLETAEACRDTRASSAATFQSASVSPSAAAASGAEAAAGAIFACAARVTVPKNAAFTTPYWQRPDDATRATVDADAPFGVPFRPTPFVALVTLDIGGAPITRELPIQHRYEGDGFAGEKRTELKVVPALAVSLTPTMAAMPIGATAGRPLAVRVDVINGARAAATADVTLQAPEGWRVEPATSTVTFAREDESASVGFTVHAPKAAASKTTARGAVTLTARAVPLAGPRGGDAAAASSLGYQVVEYPHIQRRHKIVPAKATVKLIDVAIASGVKVGYIAGPGDAVPAALAQIGADVRLLSADDVAQADLGGFDAIVTGPRAYERRADLRANSRRLLDYAEKGGVVITQYDKAPHFNRAQYGPYPARVGSHRVTDETAAVKVLVPEHQVFRWPNAIGASVWDGWVQERGLYFLGQKDAQYVDLVELADPFPFNAGVKRGALVEARVGQGRWVYVGLGLWRQVSAGTDGAYALLANLVSLRRQPPAAAP